MRARLVAALILIAGFAACVAGNLPGQLSYDSVAQLFEGRTGYYNTWHPPIMAWLLGVFDAAVPGSSLFVIFQAAILFGALLSLLWLDRRTSWLAAGVALFLVLTPQLFLYQGIVWKDVLFADAAVAGFAGLAQVCVHWHSARARMGLIVIAFVLLALAAMTRQNGVVVLFFGAVALGFIVADFGGGKARGALIAATTFCTTLIFAGAINFVLGARGDGGDGARAELAMLQTYDLVGMIHEQPALALKDINSRVPSLATAMRGDGVRLYSPVRNDTLASSASLLGAMADAPPGLIFSQWLDTISHHPFDYLKMRAVVFSWVFFTPDILLCRPAYAGIDGSPSELKRLGLTPGVRTRDRTLLAYGAHFDSTPLFSHPAFALAGVAALIFLLRRRRPTDHIFAFLLISALGFTASFFLISVACDYRYLYFLDLSVLATALYLAAGFFRSPGPQGS